MMQHRHGLLQIELDLKKEVIQWREILFTCYFFLILSEPEFVFLFLCTWGVTWLDFDSLATEFQVLGEVCLAYLLYIRRLGVSVLWKTSKQYLQRWILNTEQLFAVFYPILLWHFCITAVDSSFFTQLLADKYTSTLELIPFSFGFSFTART